MYKSTNILFFKELKIRLQYFLNNVYFLIV